MFLSKQPFCVVCSFNVLGLLNDLCDYVSVVLWNTDLVSSAFVCHLLTSFPIKRDGD